MAKTLYHSELVGMGPVSVTIKTEPTKSKFKDKPDYVGLLIGGEERTYSTENRECAEFFRGQRGRTFTIVAEGRDASAIITYVGEAMPESAPEMPPAKPPSRPPAKPPTPRAASPAPPAHQPAPPAPQPPPPKPAETPEQVVHRLRVASCKLANTYLAAVAAAQWASSESARQFGVQFTPEMMQACTSSIFIQLTRDGIQSTVPAVALTFHAPASDDGAGQ